MVQGITLFLFLQLVGEGLSRAGSWTVPGPVVGLLLLAVLLWRWPRAVAPLENAAATLHKHLALLFVPAGVGVVQYVGLLQQEALPIVVALVLSTVLGLAVTAGVTAWLMRHFQASYPPSDALSS